MKGITFQGRDLDLRVSDDLSDAWDVLKGYSRDLEKAKSLRGQMETPGPVDVETLRVRLRRVHARIEPGSALLSDRTRCAALARELTALIAELWSDPRGDMTREQERFWLLEFMCAFRGTWVIGGLWAAMHRARASRWPDRGLWDDLEPRRDRRPHPQHSEETRTKHRDDCRHGVLRSALDLPLQG